MENWRTKSKTSEALERSAHTAHKYSEQLSARSYWKHDMQIRQKIYVIFMH